nr:FliA/WhiG family RNA polymerase sigma factor [uncultured Romboutsia sp.]
MVFESQEELIVNNINIVRNIASKYYTEKIGLEYEDLVSYGVMGLIDASKKFDDKRGVKFSTYASIRVSSYIIDEIRKYSPVSRTYMSKFKEYNKSVDELQNKLFREPSIDEIAKHMNVTKKEVIDIESKMKNSNNISIDNMVSMDEKEFNIIETIEDKNIPCPEELTEKKELQDVLAKALDMLKEKDRLVLSLYYYEELTLKEIGEILGVSESRVSQLNSRAISNLRAAMKKLKYID